MSNTEEQLEKLEFEYVAKIQRNKKDRKLFFQDGEHKNHKHEGWVYVWVKVDALGGLFDVCYVGKAGKTLRARCNQHTRGLNGGSKRGLAHAVRIVEWLMASPTNEIHVYARQSAKQKVLDEAKVSMCEAEERAMIQKLRKQGAELWNKA